MRAWIALVIGHQSAGAPFPLWHARCKGWRRFIMIRLSPARRTLPLALLALGFGVSFNPALAAEKEAPDSKAASAKEAARNASERPKNPLEELNAQRDRMIAEHAELTRQLKDANEEKRKEILARIEQQKKALQEAMNAVHRQVIDERRKQRADDAKRR